MKNKLLALLVMSAISVATQAAQQKPEKCPSASAIQAYGIPQQNYIYDDEVWTGYVKNHSYDTADKWSFMITDINATDAADARNKVNAAIKSIKLKLGPEATSFPMNGWMCVYSTGSKYIAVAMNPPMLEDANLKNIVRSFK